MVFELNIDYIRSNRGMLVTAEAVLGGIGGIISLVTFSGFMSFCFWSTFMISGALVLLNVLNVYQALHAKFSFLTKVEFGYVAIWALFYIIATIWSFISWGISSIIGYVELALFLLDGFLHFRVYRSGGSNPAPADAETANEEQRESDFSFEKNENPDYDGVKSKVTETVNKMASTVAAAASSVADATKPGDDGDKKKLVK